VDLLRQTAATLLEGRPRQAGELNRPIRAPVPGQAALLLERLMGCRPPSLSLAELKQAFVGAHEHPEEISRPGRALQLALTAGALAPGLLFLFALGPLLLLAAFVFCVIGEAASEVAQDYQQRRLLGLQVALVARSDVPGKLVLAAALATEAPGYAELTAKLAEVRRDRRVVLGSLSWFMHRGLRPVEDRFRQEYAQKVRFRLLHGVELEEVDELAALGDDPTEIPRWLGEKLAGEPHWVLLAMAAWPALWCLWAAAARGGLGLWLAGITVVGADGRPAARWRCAVRALAVWAPVALLLALALWLDAWRIATGEDGRVIAWLAWVTWWSALLLLPAYVWAAMAWPNRGLHDRLAGTYQVPR
jgi:hypothetical protein